MRRFTAWCCAAPWPGTPRASRTRWTGAYDGTHGGGEACARVRSFSAWCCDTPGPDTPRASRTRCTGAYDGAHGGGAGPAGAMRRWRANTRALQRRHGAIGQRNAWHGAALQGASAPMGLMRKCLQALGPWMSVVRLAGWCRSKCCPRALRARAGRLRSLQGLGAIACSAGCHPRVHSSRL